MQKKFVILLLVLLGLIVVGQSGFMVYTSMKLNELTNVQAASQMQAKAQQNPGLEPEVEQKRVQVNIQGAPSSGKENSPITFVEFTDYECPFCKAVQPVIQEVLKKYEGKVRHVVRNYPISNLHAGAVDAALSGLCAHEQGGFWPYHDQLFEKANGGGSLTKQVLTKIAEDNGLDSARFTSCLTSKKFVDQVQKDYEDGNSYGVNGTPTFFINGRMISGNLPAEEFTKLIDEELAQIKE